MFKFRDLLIVAAVIVAVVATLNRAVIFRALDPVVAPVEYYVDAPQRERELRGEADALRQELAVIRAGIEHQSAVLAVSREERRQALAEQERLELVRQAQAEELLHVHRLLEGQETVARDAVRRYEDLVRRVRSVGQEADVRIGLAAE
jgi:hypothetical protein